MTPATLPTVSDALAEALLAEWTAYRSLFDGDHSWVGDALRPVIKVVFVTRELCALFPFTSLNRLCFSRCCYYPHTDDCPCIAAWPNEYIVQAGGLRPMNPRPSLSIRPTSIWRSRR